MRIGIDCRLWNESGVGRYIRNLVDQLQIIDKVNDYTLFVLSKDYEEFKIQPFGALQGENSKFKIRIADIRWHTVAEQLKFPAIIKREDLDLVHFPYFSVPIFYNRPFVVTIHDLILHHFPTGQASTLSPLIYKVKLFGYKYVIRKAAQKAQKIIAVSNATKQQIIDDLGVSPQKIAVTYEGVDSVIQNLKFKNQNCNSKFKIKDYFLYVGNAYPHKNLERLLEAFNLFCHPELASGSQVSRDSDLRQNDIRLVLVGKEDYFYKRLKEKVNNIGLGKEIIFFGEALDSELQYLYKNALALVIPSLMEGFGLPALETMANKCLVLASDIPALREICQGAAVYFNPYDIKDIFQKINSVYSNDKHHYGDLIDKGYKRSKLFSWRKMAEQTLAIYNSFGL